MRLFALFAAMTLLTPAAAHGRLFWQTYGATVAAPGDRAGCAWNLNQDYFVPRHCSTGRYDLFSPCKKSHTLSPACKNLHPIYAGYCTPYGSWHYKRRDHVYKTYCGCTPWSDVYGPWHLQKCCKPLHWKHLGGGRQGGCCSTSIDGEGSYVSVYESMQPLMLPDSLCNVEPMGGELLGSIAALTSGPMASGGAAPAPMPAATNVAPTLPPKLNLTPTAGASGGLPAPFNY